MDLTHLTLLGLLQGLTEFLPISSSAHLILLPEVMGWEDQGLVYDVAAHVGSLIAVLHYLRGDLKRILGAWIGNLLQRQPASRDSQLCWYLALATLPVAACGYLLDTLVSGYLRNPLVIAAASLVFGLLLWWADATGRRRREIGEITLRDALLIGLAQALSLVPGTSRSGITMTAGLMLGLERRTAARFSFLLAIPVILLAGGYEGLKYFLSGAATDWPAFITVTVVSAISAWLSIHYFLRWLETTGMLPYVIYRLLLGAVLLWVFL